MSMSEEQTALLDLAVLTALVDACEPSEPSTAPPSDASPATLIIPIASTAEAPVSKATDAEVHTPPDPPPDDPRDAPAPVRPNWHAEAEVHTPPDVNGNVWPFGRVPVQPPISPSSPDERVIPSSPDDSSPQPSGIWARSKRLLEEDENDSIKAGRRDAIFLLS